MLRRKECRAATRTPVRGVNDKFDLTRRPCDPVISGKVAVFPATTSVREKKSDEL